MVPHDTSDIEGTFWHQRGTHEKQLIASGISFKYLTRITS